MERGQLRLIGMGEGGFSPGVLVVGPVSSGAAGGPRPPSPRVGGPGVRGGRSGNLHAPYSPPVIPLAPDTITSLPAPREAPPRDPSAVHCQHVFLPEEGLVALIVLYF